MRRKRLIEVDEMAMGLALEGDFESCSIGSSCVARG